MRKIKARERKRGNNLVNSILVLVLILRKKKKREIKKKKINLE